ncbi:MAG: insulinase family protein [Oscillospiraceae bacterium]|nr:MAG: insulinase family protein [Oscillospiraceae bacterium]
MHLLYVHVADEHLDTGLELLADMLKNSTLDPYELKKEQGVVLEEISMVEDTPDDLVHELAASGYYGSASLGQTILGPRERVSAFCRDDLRRYMAKRYVTGNIVLSVAGNLDEEKPLICWKNTLPPASRLPRNPPIFLRKRAKTQKNAYSAKKTTSR